MILRAVRAIRNTHVPINRLPPEVLSRILEHRVSERDLVTATHVCRHWRSVLIFNPSLWTCFQFQYSPDHDRTLAYLERSKSTFIDISIFVSIPQDLDALGYLAPNITRTRSLSIHTFHDIRTSLLRFCNPASSLRRLEIRGFAGIVTLPDDFLAQQAPSLRSVSLSHARSTFDHFFPLPNLTEFDLYLPESAEPFRMGALLQFFSDSPLLQRIHINILCGALQDIPLDQVTSLDSLVEMNYSCNQASSLLPFLRLPRLKKLWVSSSVRPGQVQRLVDILPCGGRALLARTTKISYHSDRHAHSVRVGLFGNGVDILFHAFCDMADSTTDWFVDWFSNQTAIPFGQIEELQIGGSLLVAGFHIDVFALENLKILQVALWDGEFVEEVLRPFHPVPQKGVPCQSLREIEYTYWGTNGPFPTSLISLAEERKRAGYQLGLFCLVFVQESDRDLAEELREHVLEVQTREWDGRM